MKQEIITKLEALLQSEDVHTVAAQIKTIQSEYEEAFAKEMEKAKQEFIDGGGKANEFIYKRSAEDEKLIFLFGKFSRMQKTQKEKKGNEQDENYKIKMSIIRDIGDLSKLEVNISGAIKKLHELQSKFKETGNVPAAKHKEVLGEYNKVVDAFYFGLNLYKASQEVDLKKNFEAKTELLEKMKKLLDSENVKDVERTIKVFRGEWEGIGAVPQEKWLALKDEFKALNDKINQKIQEFYGQQKETLGQNLESKKKLVEKARTLIVMWPKTEKEWEQKTKALLEIQNEYKEAGRTDQKAGDEVWKEFREVCDGFFEKKKEFFEQAKGKYDEAKQKKQKLIEEASELKDNTDWQRTGEKLMNLQQQWKKLPNAHPKDEHRLYESFRAQCNHFFEAKRVQFVSQNAALEQNVQAKETIIQNINAYVLCADVQENTKALKEFTKQWQESGPAPNSERKRLNDAFYNKLEEFYAAIAGNEEEKQLIKFRLKIERFEQAQDGFDLLRKENDYIKKQLNDIQHQVNTFENNMGNFKSSSKTKSPLMIEMENKIAAEKAKVDEWKRKQKLVKETMDKLAKPQNTVN
ncbi:MAG TPA: DUF349 domain-containing protein [Bacteroidia bacterium]|jgi:hypothetical protein|nr:DUF349 domain-containing protein [Bacteroidia bacterium]